VCVWVSDCEVVRQGGGEDVREGDGKPAICSEILAAPEAQDGRACCILQMGGGGRRGGTLEKGGTRCAEFAALYRTVPGLRLPERQRDGRAPGVVVWFTSAKGAAALADAGGGNDLFAGCLCRHFAADPAAGRLRGGHCQLQPIRMRQLMNGLDYSWCWPSEGATLIDDDVMSCDSDPPAREQTEDEATIPRIEYPSFMRIDAVSKRSMTWLTASNGRGSGPGWLGGGSGCPDAAGYWRRIRLICDPWRSDKGDSGDVAALRELNGIEGWPGAPTWSADKVIGMRRMQSRLNRA